MSLTLIISAAALAVSHFLGVKAQKSAVVCLESYSWAFNSRSQSPCTVAAYLQGACHGDSVEFTVDPLPPNTYYVGPRRDTETPCQCNTVVYELISACADCQGRIFRSWNSWSGNCSTVYFSVFPSDVPPGTAVPNWAYMNITQTNLYNATLAREQAALGASESTATILKPTGTGYDSPLSTSRLKPNIGVLAGIIVGGVVALALIILAITCLILRRWHAQAVPVHNAPTSMPSPQAYASVYIPRSSRKDGSFLDVDSPRTHDSSSHEYKRYDPSDPSTFPTSPTPSIHHALSSPIKIPFTIEVSSLSDSHVFPHNPQGYTGAPEI